MAPTVISLLCLGLCLSQKTTAPEGTLPRPSIRVVPSSVVPKGTDVSFYCQGSQGNKTFHLWKDGKFFLQIYSSKEEVKFSPPIKGPYAAGNYSCHYSQGPQVSDFSAPLQLVVTESRVVLIATICCASVLFLLLLLCLLVFLFHHHTQHKTSHGDTPKRPSDSPQTLCLTSFSPKEIMYEDVSKGRQIETRASESEDPQGVTYSQLNTAALDEGQRAPTSVPPQPSIYATLALH